METETHVLRNKGSRSYDFGMGPGGVKRVLEPSKTLSVTEAEAKQHLNYHDIEDAAQAVPQNAEMIARLQAENATLRAEREKRIQPVLSQHVVKQVEKDIPPSEREGAVTVSVPVGAPTDGDVSMPQRRSKPFLRRKGR